MLMKTASLVRNLEVLCNSGIEFTRSAHPIPFFHRKGRAGYAAECPQNPPLTKQAPVNFDRWEFPNPEGESPCWEFSVSGDSSQICLQAAKRRNNAKL